MLHMFLYLNYFCLVLAVESPTSSTVEPAKSADVFISSNSSITNSTYIIGTTNPSSTAKLFTSVAGNITNSMTKKIAESVTTTYVIDTTEAHEHGNSKSTTIPMILAFVFGSLLGLCIAVWVIGLILRKRKKRRQIRHGTFQLAASNPLFDRYIYSTIYYLVVRKNSLKKLSLVAKNLLASVV